MSAETTNVVDLNDTLAARRIAEQAECMIEQRDVRALTELLPPQLIAELLLTYAGNVPEVYDEIDRARYARHAQEDFDA